MFLKMDSKSAINILGPEFYFVTIFFLGYPLLYLLSCVFSSNWKVKRKLRKAKNSYSQNTFIRLGIQFYVILGFAAILNIRTPVIATTSDIFSLIIAWICAMLFFAVIPIYFIGIICWN